MNIRMILKYEGTRYNGWQRQDSTDNTIQGKLEAILSKMCGVPIDIHGAGRTDSGVHAFGQVLNFHMEEKKNPEEIMSYVNRYLPEDIAVIECMKVSERFHSRLNAKGKIYQYRIWNTSKRNVFERRWTYAYEEKLDVEAMKEAAGYLIGTHDFKSFCTKKKMKKSTVRTITSIDIEKTGDEIKITYEGNGFLYHMVRIVTGTLMEVGNGTKKPMDIIRILDQKERSEAGPLVPSQGLTLLQVKY